MELIGVFLAVLAALLARDALRIWLADTPWDRKFEVRTYNEVSGMRNPQPLARRVYVKAQRILGVR